MTEFFKLFQKIAQQKNIDQQLTASHVCVLVNKILQKKQISAQATSFKNNTILILVHSSIIAHQVYSQKEQIIKELTGQNQNLSKKITLKIRTN